jgi:peroxiredoxin
MKKLNKVKSLLFPILLLLLACGPNEAVFNIQSKGFGANSVLSISLADSRQPLAAVNLDKEQQSLKIFRPEKGYAQLIIHSDPEKEFWIYLEKGNYDINTSSSDGFKYPLQHSSSQKQQELIDFYALKFKMGKDAKDLNVIQAFAKTHPATALSIFLLEQLDQADLNHQQYLHIFKSLNKQIQESKVGKRFLKDIQLAGGRAAGSDMPGIAGKDLQGKSFDKNILKKINVIICWTTYDKTSRENNIQLIALYDKYRSRGVEFIGVSLDSKEKWWREVSKTDRLVWPQYSDLLGAKSPNAENLSNHRVPYLFLTDQQGKILSSDVSIYNLDEEIERKLSH